MYCSQCGTLNSDTSKYCYSCGAELCVGEKVKSKTEVIAQDHKEKTRVVPFADQVGEQNKKGRGLPQGVRDFFAIIACVLVGIAYKVLGVIFGWPPRTWHHFLLSWACIFYTWYAVVEKGWPFMAKGKPAIGRGEFIGVVLLGVGMHIVGGVLFEIGFRSDDVVFDIMGFVFSVVGWWLVFREVKELSETRTPKSR